MQKKSQLSAALDRALCLTAIAAVGFADYGLRVPLLCVIGAAAAMLTELICLYLRKIPFGLSHLDAAVNGVVLVMLLPPTVPVTLLIISEIGAIIIGRALFGGNRNPVLPTAAVGYCIALLSDRAAVTMFPAEKGTLPLLEIDRTALVTGISGGWNKSGIFPSRVTDWLTGLPAQPIGTCSIVLLTVIAAVLLMRRSASVFVMTPLLALLLTGGWLLRGMHDPAGTVIATCLTNQTLFAVIFLFCDPDTAPPHVGGLLYGLIAGGALLWFTKLIPVTDAPVILSILLNPLAVVLKSTLEEEDQRRKRGAATHGTDSGKRVSAAQKPHSA